MSKRVHIKLKGEKLSLKRLVGDDFWVGSIYLQLRKALPLQVKHHIWSVWKAEPLAQDRKRRIMTDTSAAAAVVCSSLSVHRSELLVWDGLIETKD